MRRALIATIGTVLALTAACSSSSSATKNRTNAPSADNSMPAMPSMGSMQSGSAGQSGSAEGTTSGSAQNQTITVHTTDMLRFQPSMISAKVGTVHVKLVNDGSYPHNMDVMKLHAKSADIEGSLGGNGTTLTLHLTKPGTYPFECTYHDTAGMVGKIVVAG